MNMVSVAGEPFDVPIINISKARIGDGVENKEFDCVIGLVNHNFENANTYDCLLHRDFV